MQRPIAAALVWCSLVASATLTGAQTLPKPTGKVSDFAGVLTSAARADLESLLATLEKDTTADVRVATTTSLGGMSVEEYGNRVFNEWQIGKAALDNGVLVLVVPSERQMRIEVGYGLEGVLPDGLAGVIIRDEFLPMFRDGNFEAGIVSGVRRVADVVRARQVWTPDQIAALDSSRPGIVLQIAVIAFIAMWLAGAGMAGTMFGQALGVRSGPNLVFGILAIAIFAGLPIVFLSRTAFALVPLAIAGSVWGFRRRPLRGGNWRGGSTAASEWDWSVTTLSSGSDSGSSDGGSSESGGGSSGGGGASGSW